MSALIVDADGDLFGTASGGGGNYGTVFEIAKTGTTYASTPTTLVSFNVNNGADPKVSLVADAAGNLFGTTQSGGTGSYGTVFEVTNSGFVSETTVAAGSTLNVTGVESVTNLLDNGTVVIASGGSLDVSSAVDPSSSGTIQLTTKASLEIATILGAGLQIKFLGNSPSNELIIDSAAKFGTSVGAAAYAGPLLERLHSRKHHRPKGHRQRGVGTKLFHGER